jgi:MFS family permease
MTLGWPIAASQSGRVYLRIGFRRTALIGTAIVLVGALLMLLLDEDSSVLEVAVYCLVIGLGMGLTAAPILVVAQSSVGWAERGVVTANNIFLRSLGGALGVAVFGAIVNATIGVTKIEAGVDPGRLTEAVHRIFIGHVVIAAVMIVLVFLMPRNDRPPSEPAAESESARSALPRG